MNTLHEISTTLRAVIDNGLHIDEETGEFFDSSDLDALADTYQNKLNACACYIKSMQYEIDAYKAEEAALKKRRASLERAQDRLKDYVMCNIEYVGGKLKTPQAVISTRHSESVEILDEEALPDEFFRVKREPNKTAIKEAIKGGAAVEGAIIAQNVSLVVK